MGGVLIRVAEDCRQERRGVLNKTRRGLSDAPDPPLGHTVARKIASVAGVDEARGLPGQERGVDARAYYKLDTLDAEPGVVTIVVPDDLDAISPSFFQGMFAKSLLGAFDRDPDRFLKHYSFRAPTHVLAQVQRGINAVLTRRPGQVAA